MSGGERPFEAAPEDPKHASESSEHTEGLEPTDAGGAGDCSPEEPVIDAADLFRRVHAYMLRFAAYPSPEAAHAHLFWIVHSHLMGAWFQTPRLAIISPEPGSGKSRVLEITGCLVPSPLFTVMSSPAFIMRRVADVNDPPTVLFDEVDAIFGPKAKGSEDLRAMINSGYRRGASIGRCNSDKSKKIGTVQFPTYGAVAMAGLGDLPETIMVRSIIIRMRRRLPHETLEDFRPKRHEAEGHVLADELAAWAKTIEHLAEDMEPVMPSGVVDRDADVWTPIVCVADLAGGEWPDIARHVARHFVEERKDGGMMSLPGQLLQDIWKLFDDREAMGTQDLLEALNGDEEAPWGSIRGYGRGLDPYKLASMLRPFGVKPKALRIGDLNLRGYERSSFHDAWCRYVPGYG